LVCCQTGMDCCLGNPPVVCYLCPPGQSPDATQNCKCVCDSGVPCPGVNGGCCSSGQTCCGSHCCASGQTCSAGTCFTPGPNKLICFCNNQMYSGPGCIQDCSNAAQLCGPICAPHGGLNSSNCFANAPSCGPA
jgi:hypothetical protein